MSDNSPIFVTGTWRCGSTLVSRMLNAHPDISLIYDGVHILNFISEKEIYDNSLMNIKEKKSKIDFIIKRRFNKKINIDFSNINYFYKSILSQLNLVKNKLIYGEKSNIQWRNIPKFFKIFPNGRVLHIIRDPRAVLASWKNFTYAKGYKYIDSIFNSYDSMTYGKIYLKEYANKKYSLIKYEDLVLNPKKTINSVMKKFKIKYSHKMINFNNFENNNGKKWISNSSFNLKKKKQIYKNNIDQWKTKLEINEITLCEKLIGEIMSDFGYISTINSKNITSEEKKKFSNFFKKILNNSFLREALIKLIFFSQGQQRFPVKNKL
jgi:hypothetical protein